MTMKLSQLDEVKQLVNQIAAEKVRIDRLTSIHSFTEITARGGYVIVTIDPEALDLIIAFYQRRLLNLEKKLKTKYKIDVDV